jgi:hypothetical protein
VTPEEIQRLLDEEFARSGHGKARTDPFDTKSDDDGDGR